MKTTFRPFFCLNTLAICLLALAGPAKLSVRADVLSVPARIPDLHLTQAGEVRTMLYQEDGKLIIGGRFVSVNGVPRNNLARLNPNGSVDATWAPNIDGTVNSLALSGSNTLFVGGDFIAAASDNYYYTTNLENLVKISLADGAIDPYWHAGLSGQYVPLSIVADPNFVYVGGYVPNYFGAYGSQTNVARFWAYSGQRDNSWSLPTFIPINTTASPIQALLLDATNLYIGGYYRMASSGFFTLTNSFTNLCRIKTSLSPYTYADADTSWRPKFPPGSQPVRAIALSGSNVLVGGDFTINLGAGTNLQRLLKIPRDGGGEFDTSWKPVTNGLTFQTFAISGTNLFYATKAPPLFMRKYSTEGGGAADTNWAPGVSVSGGTQVSTLMARDGEVLIGGKFETVGGDLSQGLAKVDPVNGFRDATFAVQAEQAGEVRALVVQSNGSVIFGGAFNAAAGLPRRNLARMNADGTLDAQWNPGLLAADITNGVRAMVLTEPYVIVGGAFTNAGGLPRKNLARISLFDTGAADPNWLADANNNVHTLVLDGTNVFAGGLFTTISNQSAAFNRSRLAKLGVDTGVLDLIWSNSVSGSEVDALALDGTNLYVGGAFGQIRGILRTNLARLSTSDTGVVDQAWYPNAGIFNASLYRVQALAVYGNNIFVGGVFSNLAGAPTFYTKNFGSVSTLSNAANIEFNMPTGFVTHALTVVGTNLYVGNSDFLWERGADARNFGSPSPRILILSTPSSSLNGNAPGSGIFRAVAARGNDLLIGGSFRELYSGMDPAGTNISFRNGLAFLPSLETPTLAQPTTTQLIISPSLADIPEATHFQVTGLTDCQLFKADGVTAVNVGDFITLAEAAAGLTTFPSSPNASVSVVAAVDASPLAAGYNVATLSLNPQLTPVFRFGQAAVSVSEAGASVTLNVQKFGSGSGSVKYRSVNDTAFAGVDYAAVNRTLLFNADETNKTISIPIANDFVFRHDRRFFVELTNASAGAFIIAPQRASVTIVEDDPIGDIDSFLTTAPPAPLADGVAGSLKLNLLPPEANGQWRMFGDPQWRNSGEVASGLIQNAYQVEFKPVPGYRAPATQVLPVFSGVTNEFFTAYDALGGNNLGTLTVNIAPAQILASANPSGRGQWRLIGQTNWLDSRQSIPNLAEGGYQVEFKPVPGWGTPLARVIQVSAGQDCSAVVPYEPALTNLAGTPQLVPFDQAMTNPAYMYNGFLETDAGFGSGVVVKDRVVLTAAHVLFDDVNLTDVIHVRWMFEKYRNQNEPAPQTPRGWYVFSGYADQRKVDNSPGVSSPDSQNLDAGVLYFVEDQTGPNLPGRGGYGGFLYSENPDEFLIGNSNKMLVGYPLDGITAANRGRLHATAPTNVVFNQLYADKSVYATTNILSYGGNSGGPLYVQTAGGAYYPAGIFLGGQSKTLVRSIDSQVVDLINRAGISGNGGGNSTGGGVATLGSGLTSTAFGTGLLAVNITPNGGNFRPGWRIKGGTDTNYTVGLTTTASLVGGGGYPVEFKPVPGFITPSNRTVQVAVNQTATINVDYIPIRPVLTFYSLTNLICSGATGAVYRVEFSTNLLNWSPLLTQTLTSGSVTITNLGPTTNKARFYRTVLLP